MDLIDSNLIIYAAQAEFEELRTYIANEAPAVSAISKVETLGYHELEAEEQVLLEDFFMAALVLPVSPSVIETAVLLRQTRRMSLGDSLIAATAISHKLRLSTHNVEDFESIEGLIVFDPLGQ